MLKEIFSLPSFKGFYLAGGTALALQLGHRVSQDLDFFSPAEFKSNLIARFPYQYLTVNLFDNSIEVISKNTKIMFWYFAYSLLFPLNKIDNIILADPRDIGLMKLLALQGRTTKKDIYDLYFIHKSIINIPELISIFEQNFPKESINAYSAINDLLDIKNLEKQPEPILIQKVSWNKAYSLVSHYIAGFLKHSIVD
jgi:predicted nucleotidyltransferase component of viral defense system